MKNCVYTILAFLAATIFALLIVFSLFGFVPVWLKVSTGVLCFLSMLVWLWDGEK